QFALRIGNWDCKDDDGSTARSFVHYIGNGHSRRANHLLEESSVRPVLANYVRARRLGACHSAMDVENQHAAIKDKQTIARLFERGALFIWIILVYGCCPCKGGKLVAELG